MTYADLRTMENKIKKANQLQEEINKLQKLYDNLKRGDWNATLNYERSEYNPNYDANEMSWGHSNAQEYFKFTEVIDCKALGMTKHDFHELVTGQILSAILKKQGELKKEFETL